MGSKWIEATRARQSGDCESYERKGHEKHSRQSVLFRVGLRLTTAFRALGHPIILVLLTAAIFCFISTTRPIHAVFLVVCALALAWDRYRELTRSCEISPLSQQEPASTTAEQMEEDAGESASAAALVAVSGGRSVHMVAETEDLEAATHTRVAAHFLFISVLGLLFALVVAAFPRYSWPTTIAVVLLAMYVLAQGWDGSDGAYERSVEECAKYPRSGYIAWFLAFAFGGLWELAALLQQPSLKEQSYEHPTISALMEGVLATYWGRAITLVLWIAFGWYLLRQAKK